MKSETGCSKMFRLHKVVQIILSQIHLSDNRVPYRLFKSTVSTCHQHWLTVEQCDKFVHIIPDDIRNPRPEKPILSDTMHRCDFHTCFINIDYFPRVRPSFVFYDTKSVDNTFIKTTRDVKSVFLSILYTTVL